MICLQKEDQILTVVDDALCDADHKMDAHQDCVGTDCKGIWFEGPWGKVRHFTGGFNSYWKFTFDINFIIVKLYFYKKKEVHF